MKKNEEGQKPKKLNTETRYTLHRWRSELAKREEEQMHRLEEQTERVMKLLRKPKDPDEQSPRWSFTRSKTAPVLVDWQRQEAIENEVQDRTEATDLTGINAESDDDELPSPFEVAEEEKKDKEKDKDKDKDKDKEKGDKTRRTRTVTAPPRVKPEHPEKKRGRGVTETPKVAKENGEKEVREWKKRQGVRLERTLSAEDVKEKLEGFYKTLGKKTAEKEPHGRLPLSASAVLPGEKKGNGGHHRNEIQPKHPNTGQKAKEAPWASRFRSKTDISKSDGALPHVERKNNSPASKVINQLQKSPEFRRRNNVVRGDNGEGRGHI